jgi:glycerophosphoryl diester phosphodiesterase
VGVDFDLKSSMDDARHPTSLTADLLAPIAEGEQTRRPVAVTSFDPAALSLVRGAAPGLPVGLLTWLDFPVEHAVAASAHLDVDFLALHSGSLRANQVKHSSQVRPLPHIVEILHAANRQLLVWSPALDELVVLAAAGVDAVCVNDVRAARAALEAARG